MPGYIDAFVLPVPKKNMKAYAKMSRIGAKVWKEHGALDSHLDPRLQSHPLPSQSLNLLPSDTTSLTFLRPLRQRLLLPRRMGWPLTQPPRGPQHRLLTEQLLQQLPLRKPACLQHRTDQSARGPAGEPVQVHGSPSLSRRPLSLR